jgi:RHS repeat-associated protein
MKLRFFSLTFGAFACIALAPRAFAQAGNSNPGGVTAEYNGSSTVAGYYDPSTGNAKREITDIVVPGAVGAYSLQYTRTYNTRGMRGGNSAWTHNYQWSLSVRPPDMDPGNGDGFYDGPVMSIGYPNGGHFDQLTYDSPWHIGANGPHGASDTLINCSIAGSACNPGAQYELRRADGGKVLFYAGKAYAIIDPSGQITTLTYNVNGLWKVTEPGGRYLQLNYVTYDYVEQDGHRAYVSLLGSVQAFSAPGNLIETVRYVYTPVWITTGSTAVHDYNLTKASYDDVPSQATYTYQQSNMYHGVNTGNATYANDLHTCDDPRYAGPMKYIEYDYVLWSDAPDFVGPGQIKAEKNIAHQVVSQTTFPTSYTDPNLMRRTETRGDDAIRTISYGADGFAWTDFNNKTWTENRFANSNVDYGWTIRDPRGNTTTYTREINLNGLRKITYPQTDPPAIPATREYTFDPNNPYLHSGEKDENGNWTYFDRDPNNPDLNKRGQLRQIRYPDGSTEQFTYNSFGQVETHKLRSGGTETFVYDENLPARGLKTSSYPPATPSDPDPWNHPTRYYYYQSGANTDRLQRVQDPRGNSTSFEYNQRGQVTKVTHQDTTYTQSAYNPDGTLAWTADENHPGAVNDPNQRTRYTYDQYKRVVSVTNPMGETTSNNYGLVYGNPLLHTTNNVKHTESQMGKMVVYMYDPNFRKTYQGAALGTPDAAASFFEYDEVGNLKKVKDPRGSETNFGYDARNRKISMDDPVPSHRSTTTGHTMEWKYDSVGNKTKETRADNAFRIWAYDSMNRLSYTYDWRMSTSEPIVSTFYWRNPTSTEEWIFDPTQAIYVSTFDALLRKISQKYPRDVYGVERTETWRYDVAGNLDRYTNRAGAEKRFASYDNRNRPTAFTWSDGTQRQSFEYDAASRVTAMHNDEADVSFGYDAANRKTSETETIKSYGLNQTHTVIYGYDADGNRSRLVYPQGWDYRLTYTNRGQLQQIQLAWSSIPTVAYTYDPAGNRSRRAICFGAYTDYHYNAVNQVDTQTSYFNGSTARFDYGFDSVGRIKYEQRDSGVADGFSFDPRNELIGFNQNGTLNGNGTVTASYNVSFNYDKSGNRTDVFDGNNAHYNIALNNAYASDWTGSLGYDVNANLTSRFGWGFTYDAQNRLTAIDGWGTHIAYHYDPLNRIVARETNGAKTTQVWDNWNLIEEREADDTFRRMYFYGATANEIVCSTGPAYADTFYFQDGRGNVTHLTGPTHNLIERITYFVAGQPNIVHLSGPSMDNRFLFEGALYVPEAQMYDMRNRFYHPNLGRFLQSDPIGLQTEGEKLTAGQKAFFGPGGAAPEAFSTSEMNLYRYCGNDPVDGSDPIGLLEFKGTVALQKLTTVLGSNIPQWLTVAALPISFTTSGNFSNSNPGSHVVAAGSLGYRNGQALKGRTDADVGVKRQSGGLAANLNINYYVIANKYNDLERQHTFGDLGGGSKVKGLLEKGGYWDQMQRNWSGGISDFLGSGRWRLESDLRSELSRAKSAQIAEWELTPGSGHDVRW